MDLHCMDYRVISAQGPALSQVNADALIVVLTPDLGRTGDTAIDRLIDDAMKSDDFTLKAGKSLYVHRPAGVKAARLLLCAAGNASAKAFKAAAAKAVAQVKDLVVAHAAFAVAKGMVVDSALSHYVVLAVAVSAIIYTQLFRC